MTNLEKRVTTTIEESCEQIDELVHELGEAIIENAWHLSRLYPDRSMDKLIMDGEKRVGEMLHTFILEDLGE